MQVDINIGAKRKELKDFTRLVLSFFFCLVLMAIYQNARLYWSGVLDSILNKSFFLLMVHHLGFVSISALFLAFLFNFLERIKPNLGFKTVTIILLLILVIEGLLTNYYVDYYEILGAGFYDRIQNNGGLSLFYGTPILLLACSTLMYLFYRITANIYSLINRMYPFTIILFSLFLATLISRKNPVNENKTQYLLYHQAKASLDFNKYEGAREYPLLKPFDPPNGLADHFSLGEKKPNLVFIVMDGVGADFIGEKAVYKAFMPYMNSLLKKSLYWPHYVSNTGESVASIPSVFGSLPFGENGFTNNTSGTDRETLFGLLKANGYQTSFNFGGNSSLDNLGKFLFEEKIDLLVSRKAFGPSYSQQEEDAAGISLGYPDGELFQKWYDDFKSTYYPRLDVFLTQSTKNPFNIPQEKKYIREVEEILSSGKLTSRNRRLISKNDEIFASLLYTDDAIKNFMEQYRRKAEFQNTIFVITGSHNLTDLPQADHLGRYKVPLIIYSPLLRSPARIGSLVAHTDILPSITGLLYSKYEIQTPNEVSWLGEGLVHQGFFKKDKIIPLYRHRGNIQEFIKGNHCVSGSSFYEIGADLTLFRPKNEDSKVEIKEDFRNFKAINTYVTMENKLIPVAEDKKTRIATPESKSDMVWINSVFNSDDYDNAYRTARDLAIEGKRDRALLLCQHILEEVPGHADTEILMGRIHAWNKEYAQAATILETAIKKYPVYADGYSALLDVYFWADTNYKVADVKALIRKNRIENDELHKKIKRAEEKMKKEKTLFDSGNLGFLDFEDDIYE
ncbi:MAG: sulfatase-like hydrolase/transferase [Eudoraea sp.]|nr:sulfatase-like hydrolase/transferase [Eudoraea sp.]